MHRLLCNAPPPQRLRYPFLLTLHWPQRSPIQPPGREGGVAARCRVGGPSRSLLRAAVRAVGP